MFVTRRDLLNNDSLPRDYSRVDFDKIADLARQLRTKIITIFDTARESNKTEINQDLSWLGKLREFFARILALTQESRKHL